MRTSIFLLILLSITIFATPSQQQNYELGISGGLFSGNGLFLKYNASKLSFKVLGGVIPLENNKYSKEIKGTLGYRLYQGKIIEIDLTLSALYIKNYPFLVGESSASGDSETEKTYFDLKGATFGAQLKLNLHHHFKLYLSIEALGGIDDDGYGFLPTATLGASIAF